MMKTERIVKTLKRLKLDAWSLNHRTQRRCTLHLTKKEEIETSITALRDEADVTIRKRYAKQLGDARFTLFTDEEQAIEERVKDALAICATAKKQPWPLPKRQPLPSLSSSPFIKEAFDKEEAEELLLTLSGLIRGAVRNEKGITLSHCELHLNHVLTRIINSAGQQAEEETGNLFIEVVMTAARGREEAEFHHALTFGSVGQFDPTTFIAEASSLARDALAAEKMTTLHEGPIILSGIALRDFWAPDLTLNSLIFHATAAAKHRKLSRHERGARITKNTGFSLGTEPLLEDNPASRQCDDEGVPSKAVTIIKNGKWHDLLGSQRYSHYLKSKPTGHVGSIKLATGEKSIEFDGAIEIVSFSSFVPNSMSGDFSAEIRLGYLHKDGEKRPLKGAMFTGNIYRMLDTMTLSHQEMTLDRYTGPAQARFDGSCHLAGF